MGIVLAVLYMFACCVVVGAYVWALVLLLVCLVVFVALFLVFGCLCVVYGRFD